MRISKLLLGDHRSFSNVIAIALGVNEAIVLNQIDYWLDYNQRDKEKRTTHFFDNRWWAFNTYEEWREHNFQFWSMSTIKRVFSGLEDRGQGKEPIILSKKYDPKNGNHTKWYSIDYDALDEAILPFLPDSFNLTLSRSGQSDTNMNVSNCTDQDQVNLTHSFKETETTFSEITNRENIPPNPQGSSPPPPDPDPKSEPEPEPKTEDLGPPSQSRAYNRITCSLHTTLSVRLKTVRTRSKVPPPSEPQESQSETSAINLHQRKTRPPSQKNLAAEKP